MVSPPRGGRRSDKTPRPQAIICKPVSRKSHFLPLKLALLRLRGGGPLHSSMLPLLIACHRRTGPGKGGAYAYSYGLLAFPVSGPSPGGAYFCLAIRRTAVGAATGSPFDFRRSGGAAAAVSDGAPAGVRPVGAAGWAPSPGGADDIAAETGGEEAGAVAVGAAARPAAGIVAPSGPAAGIGAPSGAAAVEMPVGSGAAGLPPPPRGQRAAGPSGMGHSAPVVALSRAFYATAESAMHIFERIAFAREPVSPHHIDDITSDLLIRRSAGPG